MKVHPGSWHWVLGALAGTLREWGSQMIVGKGVYVAAEASRFIPVLRRHRAK